MTMIHAITAFRVGEYYTNDQIRFALGVENLGGIRPSVDEKKQLRHVVVMTAAEESSRSLAENPYQDRIEGDILVYTAQGRTGDQQLSGRNKRLIEQYTVPIPFYGFCNVGKQTYQFLGLLELLRHYQETQADKHRDLRKVWLFEFLIHRHPEIVPIEQATAISASLLSESRQNPLSDQEREVVGATNAATQPAEAEGAIKVEEVRGQLMQIDPYKFEHLIKEVMTLNGFVNVTVTSASGDGGVDVNAWVSDANDFFANTHVQAQVKRWRHAIGSVEINKFRGALNTTAKGVFITTSHYTRAAVLEARHQFKPCITLIDGNRLSTIIVRSQLEISSFLTS
jgi:hypothetical protein